MRRAAETFNDLLTSSQPDAPPSLIAPKVNAVLAAAFDNTLVDNWAGEEDFPLSKTMIEAFGEFPPLGDSTGHLDSCCDA